MAYMTLGRIKKIAEELELSDDAQIKIEYSGGDMEIERKDCFQIKVDDYELIIDDWLVEHLY